MPVPSRHEPWVMRRWGLSVVRGESMRPTLRPGDLLAVAWLAPVRPGDLVVARLPGGRGVGVKRALRAEPLEDGTPGWWLERDNPATGADSWLFGSVPAADVLGVVRGRLWPGPRRFRA